MEVEDLEEVPRTYQTRRTSIIKIKSYAEVFIETPSYTNVPKRDSFKNGRHKTSLSKVGENEVSRKDSLWDGKREKQQQEEDDGEVEIKPSCCFKVFSFCCGCHAQHKWYSLRGKGILIVPMLLLLYIIAGVATLPVLLVVGAACAFLACLVIMWYLALFNNSTSGGIAEVADEIPTCCWCTIQDPV